MLERIPDVVNVSLPLIREELPLVSVADTSVSFREREVPDSEDVLFPPDEGILVPVPAPAVPVRVPEPAEAVMEEFQPPNVDESLRVGLLRPELADLLSLPVTEPDVSVIDSEADGSPEPGLPAFGAPVSVDDSSDVPEPGSRVVAVGSPMVQLPEPVDPSVVVVGSPEVKLPEPVDSSVVTVDSLIVR